MNIEEAIQILKDHNKWRRGADMPMTDPKILGEAIDCIVDANVEIVAQSYGKGFAQGQEIGEKETIDKACKYLDNTLEELGVLTRYVWIDAFRKAMEE